MVASEQTIKHLSWFIGLLVAKLPFGIAFFFFFDEEFSPLGNKKKSGANKLKGNEL
jgi:hypothetical protein